GVTLTAQQPYNNVARVALQALAAVLGGTQSLHTNSLDETYALPTEEAVTVALRTQQILLHESGVASAIDPLAGSYHVEWVTNRIEALALEYIQRIDAMGGMVQAVEEGYPQREIARSAYEHERALASGERVVVGVNRFRSPEQEKIPTLRIAENVAKEQLAALAQVKAGRSAGDVAAALARVRDTARSEGNLMPRIVDAARVYATEQEICDVLRDVFGTHSDRAEF
ncbi:MAG TPA: methylmalonyl-CoA mutase family protein, partial [Polyangiaceae bacterium]|nr:methylmalonyl-CoA mutase family protein [Polyangiaceae bacterium]